MDLRQEIEGFVTGRLITGVIGKIKEGKEAAVHLCRAHADTGQTLFAAKLHRAFEHRRFRDDAVYREGRVIGSRTVAKSMARRSRFGQQMLGATWLDAEYRALCDMADAGVRVPAVFGRGDRALLLEFIGSPDGEAAPPLRALHPTFHEAQALWLDLRESMQMARGANLVHADLSPYNILVQGREAHLIDWPPAVDPRKNPNARWLWERDVRNVLAYFARFGVTENAAALADALWRDWSRGRL